MLHEVARVLRYAAPGEVGGRSHDREPQVTRQRHRDHVLVDNLAELNPGIVAVRHDVDHRSHNQVELHVRVIARKPRSDSPIIVSAIVEV